MAASLPDRVGELLKHGRRRFMEGAAAALVKLLGQSKRMRRTMVATVASEFLDDKCRMLTQFEDHALLVDPKDPTIAFELMSGREWQRREITNCLGLLEQEAALAPNGIFVDVGANIGTQTIYAMLSGKFSRALAIEPAPENVKLLKYNIAENRLSAQVACVDIGAAEQEAVLRLYFHSSNSGGHSVVPDRVGTSAGSILVRTAPVDTILAEQGLSVDDISLVWIDVEGMEQEVLRGMEQIRQASTPIVFEYTPHRDGAATWKSLLQLLGQHYDRCVELRQGGSPGTLSPGPLLEMPEPARQSDLLVFRQMRGP